MKNSIGFGVIFLVSPFLFSCDSGSKVNAATKLISTTLASRQIPRGLETTLCGKGFVACITPSSVVGKAYYAGMIVGQTDGLSLGPMLGTVLDPSEATAFTESDLNTIDLGQQLSVSGTPTLGGPIPYPSDNNALVQNFHVYFGWMDTTFTFTSSDADVGAALETTHVIRQVMADITGTEYKKGDLLYRPSSESGFKWCESSTSCTSTTRPTTPLQNSAIASFANTGEGNKTIPSFFMNPADGATPVQVKKSDLENKANTNTFTVDIAMAKGVKFTTAAAAWTSVGALVSAFRLPADPGASDTGFTATITYTP